MSGVAVVTGANGYLAQALMAKLLRLGMSVRGVSRSPRPCRPDIEHVKADIRDVNALVGGMACADVVFHLVAHTHDIRSADDSALQQSVTLGGTLAALEAAERCHVRHFIFASSLAVFGAIGEIGASEDHPCTPRTAYGRSKLDAERAVCDFAARTGARAASIRPAMIYGVNCPGNLGRMIRAVRHRRFPPIPEFGNKRSFIAVDDAAEAMILAWTKRVRGGRPFNVTDGTTYSTREIYDMIRTSLGRPLTTVSLPRSAFWAAARAGDLGRRVLGRRLPFDGETFDRLAGSALFVADRARKELGFSPTTTLREVLPEMVRETRQDAR